MGRQPSTGPSKTDSTYLTPGGMDAPSIAVPYENFGVISDGPAYLMNMDVHLASTAGEPMFLFVFDQPAFPNVGPDMRRIRIIQKLIPGVTTPIPIIPESRQLFEDIPAHIRADMQRGCVPIEAYEDSLFMPFDNGIIYSLSTSDIQFLQPAVGGPFAYTTARVRRNWR